MYQGLVRSLFKGKRGTVHAAVHGYRVAPRGREGVDKQLTLPQVFKPFGNSEDRHDEAP